MEPRDANTSPLNKILIIGRGQIGSALTEALRDFEAHVWSHDLDDLSSEAIEVIAPFAIINAAGKTDLALCEANAREAVRSNLEAPVRLYDRILRSANALGFTPRFVHLSSGCIWDGPYKSDGTPFEPNDPASPAALYSWTKASADALLLERDPDRIAILRPRQVYSNDPSPRNTLVKLSRYPRLIDTPNSMSSMRTIERTIRYALQAREEWAGVWNVYDSGVVTPFEVGEMLAEAGLREAPERIAKEDLDEFHWPKRVDTVLHDERFERLVQPNDVHSELQRAIAGLRERLVTAAESSRRVSAPR